MSGELIPVASRYKRQEPHFDTPEDVKRWTRLTAERLDDMATDTVLAAVVVRRVLEKIPDGKFGLSSRVRARAVVWYLNLAVKRYELASRYVAGTYLQLLRQFSDKFEA
jgi:hypothetical protein